MDYAQLQAAGWEVEAGEYTFTLNAYKETTTGESEEATTDYKKVLTADDTETLTAGKETTLSFTLKGVSGEGLTGSISVTVDFSGSTAEKDNVKTAKVAFGNTIADAGEDNATGTNVTLDKTAYTVTYTNDAVKAATTQYVTFFFYDDVGTLKGRYTESVYVLAGDTVSKTRAIDALNKGKYPYTVYSQDFEDVTDATEVVTLATASNMQPTASMGSSDGNSYAKVDFNSANIRGQTARIATGLPSALNKDYTVNFDLKLSGPNAASASANQAAQFVLGEEGINLGANGAYSGKYLLALYNYAVGTGNTASEAAATHPNNSQNNLWALSLDATGKEITLDRTLWYHVTVVVDENSVVTATITASDGTVVLNNEDVGATSSTFGYVNMLLGRASGNFYIDNLVVKSASDIVSFTSAAAITASDDDGVIEADGTDTLSASAAAAWVVAGTTVTPTYSWSLAAADSDYAALSAETGDSVTLTGKNSTISDYTATVTLTATAGSGDNAVTSTASKQVKILALQSLLSDITFAENNESSVSAGSDITLSITGGEKASSLTDDSSVSIVWASSKTEVATVDSTGKVSGLAEGSTTITVTATLGSIVKTASCDITVTASQAALSALTLTGVTGTDDSLSVTVKKGFTASITATTNDNVVPDSWSWVSADTDAFTVTGSGDSYENTATLTGVAVTENPVTLTLTATKDTVTVTKTIYVTVAEPEQVTLYSQNFESGEGDWTEVRVGASKVFADDATSNANSSSYIYGVGGSSAGDAGTQVAVSSSADGTTVEFDLKFDGVYTNKSSSFALLGAKNTANWLSSDKEILTFSAGTGGTAGYINTFTINGVDYFEACAVTTDGSEISSSPAGSTLKRGSTGWLHVKAVLNFTAHTMDLLVTRISTGATVCSVSELAFMDGEAASSLEYIYAAGGKTYGGVFMDNFVVQSYK